VRGEALSRQAKSRFLTFYEVVILEKTKGWSAEKTIPKINQPIVFFSIMSALHQGIGKN
jgi:hypothetical protein